MREAKCPACRRRFLVDAGSVECARCGADLSLLVKLRHHADRLVVDALADPSLGDNERMNRLRQAQLICRSPEVQHLLSAFAAERCA